MTTSVAEHYANHLAPIYSWMVGDFDAACGHADAFYQEINLPDGNGRLAVDLGCGHGVHSVPLARRGYRLLSIDHSDRLLGELESVAEDLPIRTMNGDLTEFDAYLQNEPASLITCMGDTLTHLASVDTVRTLLRDAALNLAPDVILTLSFRDYTTVELLGTERIIPVRSDQHRIHTCFLEYQPETVIVHDIIHSLVESSWQMAASAYRKIRLAPDTVVATASEHELTMAHRTIDRGMLYLAFVRS